MTEIATRKACLRDILLGRRRELQADVRHRVRQARTDRPNDVRDEIDDSEAHLSDEVEFALIQMKAEMMGRIDQALGRLATGDYGRCCGCDGEIAESRLRALPFAVRCTMCEQGSERGLARARRLSDRAQACRASRIW